MIVGASSLITGVLGWVYLFTRKTHVTCIFSTLTVVIGLLLIMAGSVALSYGNITSRAFATLCENFGNRAEIEKIREMYRANIDSLMCSDKCPCWSGYMIRKMEAGDDFIETPSASEQRTRHIWTQWREISEATYNSFGRTKTAKGSSVQMPLAPNKAVVTEPMVWKDYKYDMDGK